MAHENRPGGKGSTHEKTHAISRADERYGLHLTAQEYANLSKLIRVRDQRERDRNALYIAPDPSDGTRTYWLVRYHNHWYPVVYDKSSHRIVTFLPENAIQLEPHRKTIMARLTKRRRE
jgi:hypothetical protein